MSLIEMRPNVSLEILKNNYLEISLSFLTQQTSRASNAGQNLPFSEKHQQLLKFHKAPCPNQWAYNYLRGIPEKVGHFP